MQSDGNLVLKDNRGKVGWASNTWGNSGAVATLQEDGNLVVMGKEQLGGCLFIPDKNGWADAADSTSLDLQVALKRYDAPIHELWRAEMVFKAPTGTSGTWLFRKADGNQVNYGCRLNTDRTITCLAQSTYPGGAALTSTTAVSDDRYHTLRLSVLGNKLELYLDMRLEASLSIENSWPNYANSQPLLIGVNDLGQGGGALRVSNFYLMKSGADTNARADVYANWRFETDGKDRSGHGNDLSLRGSTAVRQYFQQCQ
jgi:hypothetical protein